MVIDEGSQDVVGQMVVSLYVKKDDTAKLDWTKTFSFPLITCERNMGEGENVRSCVRLNMGQGGWDQRWQCIQPYNTTLK